MRGGESESQVGHHFITPPYRVGTFVLWRAAALIAVTATLGYVFGRVIGVLWNAVHTGTQRSPVPGR